MFKELSAHLTDQLYGGAVNFAARVRFIGNGRLVRNAVGSHYYLTSLSANYVTTIGKITLNR